MFNLQKTIGRTNDINYLELQIYRNLGKAIFIKMTFLNVMLTFFILLLGAGYAGSESWPYVINMS